MCSIRKLSTEVHQLTALAFDVVTTRHNSLLLGKRL